MAKLVTRKTENGQPSVLILGMEFVEFFVVGLGEATLGCNIDYQQDLALVFVEFYILIIDVFDGEVVDRVDIAPLFIFSLKTESEVMG